MCVGRKPHPFGNERHTICCGIISILWRSQIFKEKDRPSHLVPKLRLELGKTAVLMLQMCKPIFSTGKFVVMYSNFCASNIIVPLVEKGVHARARWYWPKSVPRDLIDRHFV